MGGRGVTGCGDGQGLWAMVPLGKRAGIVGSHPSEGVQPWLESSGGQARMGWAAWGPGIYSPQEEGLPWHSLRQFWGLSQLFWASTPLLFSAQLLLCYLTPSSTGSSITIKHVASASQMYRILFNLFKSRFSLEWCFQLFLSYYRGVSEEHGKYLLM